MLATLLAGCYAGTHGGPIHSTPHAKGIRYFLPSMYLVVQQDPAGTLTASFEVMADSSKEYYVEPFIILARQNVDIILNADGTLQSFKLEQDGTPVSTAVVAAVKDVALKKLDLEQAAAGRAARAAPPARADGDRVPARVSRVWMFRIDGRRATLAEGRAVPVPEPAEIPPAPTGTIDGTFSITIDGGAAGRKP